MDQKTRLPCLPFMPNVSRMLNEFNSFQYTYYRTYHFTFRYCIYAYALYDIYICPNHAHVDLHLDLHFQVQEVRLTP